MNSPQSCDTFVVLPPLTSNGVVFGKNSDRPQNEVQEVVYITGYTPSGRVKCTYIEVENTGPIQSVILSKPGWMWGAEMGANENGVAIGNEAVWTRDTESDADPSVKRLLGMDLVRLGLERGKTATEALEVMIELLEKYGQGGPCSNTDLSLCYHNSFLITDSNLAWILETAGKHWVAERVTEGYRNISNALTITTKIDRMSNGLHEYAKNKGFWNGEGEFNFAESFSTDRKPGCERYEDGKKLLKKLTDNKLFCEKDMFSILRNKETGICRDVSSPFPTQGSQVSTLRADKHSIHWFTATPDPSQSVFKPFAFTPNAKISVHTQCASDNKSPHTLYALNKKVVESGDNNNVLLLLRAMEGDCVTELITMMDHLTDDKLNEFDELFKDCVETEVKFYR